MKNIISNLLLLAGILVLLSAFFVKRVPSTTTYWVKHDQNLTQIKEVVEYNDHKILVLKSNNNVLRFDGKRFVDYPDGRPCKIVDYHFNPDGRHGGQNFLFSVLIFLFWFLIKTNYKKYDNWD